MGHRTYIPELFRIVNVVCRYIGRWNAKIRENLPPEAIPAFDNLSAACEAFVLAIDLVEGA